MIKKFEDYDLTLREELAASARELHRLAKTGKGNSAHRDLAQAIKDAVNAHAKFRPVPAHFDSENSPEEVREMWYKVVRAQITLERKARKRVLAGSTS